VKQNLKFAKQQQRKGRTVWLIYKLLTNL